MATFRVIDGSGPACNAPGRYCEVQKAIHHASAGDTILVSPGTYAAFVVDRDDLTIRGLTRSGARPVITTSTWSPVVRITASQTRLSTFEVRGVSGIVVEGRRNQISDNLLSATRSAPLARGIEVRGSVNQILNNRASGFDANFTINGDGNQGTGNQSTGGNQGFLVGGSSHQLRDNLATQAATAGYSLSGSGHLLQANLASDSGAGFVVTGSLHQLTSNTARNNQGDGFRLRGGQLSRVIDNDAAGNGAAGIRTEPTPCEAPCVPPSPGGHTLVNNRADANRSGGIVVQGHRDTVDFNVVTANGEGGIVVHGNSARLFANHGEANTGPGILITGDAGTFTENVVVGNSGPGFLLQASASNILSSNSSTGHDTNYFLLESTQCRLLENLAADGGSGFVLLGSHDNWLSGNRAEQHQREGIQLDNSHQNHLTGNALAGNSRAPNAPGGLVLRTSVQNQLEANEVTANGGEAGVTVAEGSHENGFRANLIAWNAGHGLLIRDSLRGQLEENSILENGRSGLSLLAADAHAVVRNRLQRNSEYGIYVDALLSNYFAENDYEGNGLGDANLPGVC